MGIVDKNTLGVGGQGLIHLSMLDLGSDSTRIFMAQIQVIVNYWLLQVGVEYSMEYRTRPTLYM